MSRAVIASLFRAVWLACLLAFGSSTAWSQAAPYKYATLYDAEHRVVGTIAPDPDGSGPLLFAAERRTYDSGGRLTKVEKGQLATWEDETANPGGPSTWTGFSVYLITSYTYDAFDRKTTESVSSSTSVVQSLTQYSYDNAGRLQCTAVRMNSNIYGSLPASACTLGTQGNFGPDRITENVYDAAGRLTQIIKAYGVTTTAGFPQTLQEAYATYAYSANGKQTDVTDANGNHAKLVYDGFDRQIAWIFPSSTTSGAVSTCNSSTVSQTTVNWADGTSVVISGPPNATNSGDNCEKYSYDANGNKIILVKRDGSILSYEQDALNRVIEKFVPQRTGLPTTDARSVKYSYDLLGHRLTATFADLNNGATEGLTFAYDGFGRMTSSSIAMDGVTRTLTYTYDADDNRTQVTHPDGTYFTDVYDGLDRLQNATWWSAATNGPQVPFLSITYDSVGRRSQVNRASSFTFYGYDGVSRLNSLAQQMNGVDSPQQSNATVTQGFSFNPASQIVQRTTDNTSFAFAGEYTLTRTYGVNGLNQYVSAGAANFTYDANGNLTADGSNNFVYDIENRLVGASGAHTAAIRYDPLGRIYEVAGSDPTKTTRFLYDGDSMVGEYSTSGTQLQRYMWGADPVDLVLWDQGSALNCSGTSVAASDNQGSVIAWASCNGIQTGTNTYDEYGIPGAYNNGRFQYTGQAWIRELGMYYYKARMYSPTLGRFMQTDPIGYADQVNLYAYVGNDPLNKSDYSGDFGCTSNGNGTQTCTSNGSILDNAALGIYAAYTIAKHAVEQALHNEPAPHTPPTSAPYEKPDDGQIPSKTPNTGEPGSTYVNPGSGQVRQYGADGKPIKDTDHDHDHGQGTPHEHEWTRDPSGNPVRGPGTAVQPQTAPVAPPPPPPPPPPQRDLT